MKKIISFFLCTLMLIPFAMPFASAADAVGKIIITVDTDIDGVAVDDYSEYITLESEGVIFEESMAPAVEAFNTTTETYDSVFEGGNFYVFTIKITEAPYFALPSAGVWAEVVLNGEKYAVMVQEKNVGSEVIPYISLEVELYVGDPMKCLKAIDFLVPAPVAGATPADVSQVYANNMGVTVASINWFPEDPIFVEGTEYTFTLSLEAADGYVFDKNIYLSHDMADAAKIGSGKNELKMSYTFPATPAAPEPTVITELNATVIAPVAGEAPSNVISTSGTGYTVSVLKWLVSGNPTETITEFKQGKNYEVQVKFTPENGYVFADDVTAKINDKNAFLCMENSVTGEKTFVIVFTLPLPEYNISVTNGTASASKATEGTKVTLTANAAPAGKVFDKWVVSGATVADTSKVTTTFTMPENDVTAQATYKNVVYKVTVTNGKASASTAVMGGSITLTANQIDGKVFSHWEISGAAASDKNAKETTVTVGTSDVTAEAIYEDCPCKCHQGGIAGFFYKIVLFFQKLFGNNKICEFCGAKH